MLLRWLARQQEETIGKSLLYEKHGKSRDSSRFFLIFLADRRRWQHKDFMKSFGNTLRLLTRITGWLVWFLFLFLTLSLAFLVGFFSQVVQEMPLLDKLAVPEPVQASRIYAADGTLLGNVYAEEGNRVAVAYDQIPDYLKKALIAIEDRDFYKHRGVDLRGITRAFKANIEAGGKIQQGGSTITQQLVRRLFLEKEADAKDRFMRKIKEIIIALRLEKNYSKDEILTFYLNEMFFGSNSYGIEAASQNYFGKPAKDLTIAQAALIAGLPQAPSVLSPYVSMEKATKRRDTVLKAMLNEGYITRDEYEKAINEKIVLAGSKNAGGYRDLHHPYYCTYVLDQAKQIVGQRKLYFGGLRIYTNLDIAAQKAAEENIRKYVLSDEFKKADISQGAFVLISTDTGAVIAMVGGVDFGTNEFNRAWQAKRQAGSSFKPFTYLAALEQGYSPGSYVIDKPAVFYDDIGRKYEPQNYDHKYLGIITMKKALELSRNIPAVKTCDLVGPEEVVRWARNLGIHEGELDPYISIALGAGAVSPIEMASAFATISDDGIYNEPFAIRMITDSNGEIIYQHTSNPRRVANKNLCRLMTYMLKGVITQGTGTRAKINHDCAGKTGTTSDYKDAWFIGYTPEYSGVVWVGNDDESKHMKRVTGGVYCAKVWRDIMKVVIKDLPEKKFEQPKYPGATMSLERGMSQSELQEMLKAKTDEEAEKLKSLELGGDLEAPSE